jgi:hypothetical protein
MAKDCFFPCQERALPTQHAQLPTQSDTEENAGRWLCFNDKVHRFPASLPGFHFSLPGFPR